MEKMAKDAVLSPTVQALLRELTDEEKVSLLHGANGDPYCANQAGFICGVERLGIPELFLADGEAGVNTSWEATMLPAKIGLGATFDVESAREYGEVLGREIEASGLHMLLAPRLNVIRDFIAQFNTSNGGCYQAYSEDPVLIGKLCAAEIRGIQENGRAIATCKQFAASSTGTAQGAGNSVVDKQTLFEVYLRPFEDAVKAGVGALMTSYNQINGIWSYRHPLLHGDVLRGSWGFAGPAMNDWFCMYETEAICDGVTLEMPGKDLYGQGQMRSYYGLPLLQAAKDPESPVQMEDIDRAVGYYLHTLERFGLLGTKRTPHAVNDAVKQWSIPRARELAVKTGVLLKNDGTLPLHTEGRNVLFVGETARRVCSPVFKENAFGFADRKIGTLQAMEEFTGEKIEYVKGEDLEGVPIPTECLTPQRGAGSGLTRQVICLEDKLEKRIRIPSLPPAVVTFESPDPQVCFTGENALPPLNAQGEQGRYYYMWSGSLLAPETGWYRLCVQSSVPTVQDFQRNIHTNSDMDVGLSSTLNFMAEGKNCYERIASGPRLNYNGGPAPISSVVPCEDGFNNVAEYVYMKAGGTYPIFLTVTSLYYMPVQVRLNWVTPSMAQANLKEVEQAARQADTVVVFAWHSNPSLNLALNPQQEKVIEAAAANCSQVAVVLNSGGPVLMPWLDKVNAVLEMWYPGQEGGRATADLLLGRKNPSGKLPVTFPRRLEDCPAHDPAHPERYAEQGKLPGAHTKQTNVACFTEGVLVGYRWWDEQRIEPLFPFGYGLSYTAFSYRDLNLRRTEDGGLEATFFLKNTGKTAGAEVVQCYLQRPEHCPAEISVPPQTLAAFLRVELDPGEEKCVILTIPPRELSYFAVVKESDHLEEGEGWRILHGTREVCIGASSRDLRLRQKITI